MPMALKTGFRESEAEALYRESLSAFEGVEEPLGAPLVDLVYYNAALEDEDAKAPIGEAPTLTVDEAREAYETLDRCFPRAFGCTSPFTPKGYSQGCAALKVAAFFSLEKTTYAAMAGKNKADLTRKLIKINDPRFVFWLWRQTEGNDFLRYLLFYHPGTSEVLVELARMAENPNFDIKKMEHLIMRTVYLLPYQEPDIPQDLDDPDDVSLFDAQMDFLASSFTHYALRALHLYQFELILFQGMADPEATLRIIEDMADSGNIQALGQFIKRNVVAGADPGPLIRFADEVPVLELVPMTFAAMALYRDRRVTHYLFDRLINGPFQIHLQAFRALLFSRDREEIVKRARVLSFSRDPFEAVAGKKLLQAMEKTIPLGEDHDNNTDWFVNHRWKEEELEVSPSWKNSTFTTQFFRYPRQLRQIANELKRIVVGRSECVPLRLVSVGGSSGAEIYSLMMYLDSDFRKNPGEWDGFDPLSEIEFFTTDIDEVAIAYALRGRYSAHPSPDASDINGLIEQAKAYGIDLNRYFERDDTKRVYQVREEWRRRIRTVPLDILNPSEFVRRHGQPDIVLYNMVDGHLSGAAAQIRAAHNVLALAREFVATTPHYGLTRRVLLFNKEWGDRKDRALLIDTSGERRIAEAPASTSPVPTLEAVLLTLKEDYHYTGIDPSHASMEAASILESIGAKDVHFRCYTRNGQVLHSWLEATLQIDGKEEVVVFDLVGEMLERSRFGSFEVTVGKKSDIVKEHPLYRDGIPYTIVTREYREWVRRGRPPFSAKVALTETEQMVKDFVVYELPRSRHSINTRTDLVDAAFGYFAGRLTRDQIRKGLEGIMHKGYLRMDIE